MARKDSSLRVLLVSVSLGIIATAMYAPSVTYSFVRLDDFQYVVDNEVVRNPTLSGAWRFISEVRHPSTVEGYYQPLAMLSLLVDGILAGQPAESISPLVFHLMNIVLHAVTTVLVFQCLRLMVGGLWGPSIAALFFAIHPVQVETVSWISQRKSLLATPLAIGCLIYYIRAARNGSRGSMTASFVLYLLANLAKPTVVLLPLALPLLDFWPLRRNVWAALRKMWPFFAVMPLFTWIAIESQASAGEGTGVGLANLTSVDLAMRWIALLCYNIMLYVGNVLVPLYLSPFRDIPRDLSLSNSAILLSLVGTAGLVAIWIRSIRKAPAFFVGFAGAMILLLPALGPVRFMASCVADRFLYLPMFFLLIPVASFLRRIEFGTGRLRRGAWLCTALVLVPLVILNRAQQLVWQDSKTLWSHVAASMPGFTQARSNLGMIALSEGDVPSALKHATVAHEMDPTNPHHMHLLARAFVRSNRAKEALPIMTEAIRIGLAPTEAAGRVALAEILICLGDDAGAEASCREAIRLGFTPARCYGDVAEIAMRQARRHDVAAAYYRKAVELEPNDVILRWNLGTALEYNGQGKAALQEYEAVRLMYEKKGLSLPAELQQVMQSLARRLATSQPAPES